MDHPAALHRIQVGLPATVEHASEGGIETAQAVAETTQVISVHDLFIGFGKEPT
jgi:VPS28 protein